MLYCFIDGIQFLIGVIILISALIFYRHNNANKNNRLNRKISNSIIKWQLVIGIISVCDGTLGIYTALTNGSDSLINLVNLVSFVILIVGVYRIFTLIKKMKPND